MRIEEFLEYGRRFHGHLGPFLVLGLRMGRLGAERLGNPDPVRALEAAVELENKRPMSCTIDGIQVASGCTLGKGNITIKDGPGISAVFRSNGNAVRIAVRDGLVDKVLQMLKEMSGENAAERVMAMPVEELFEVENA